MKILVAVDGSEYTTKAVNFVLSHLDWFQGERELHLLHVEPPIPLAHARAAVTAETLEGYYRDESAAALDPAEKLVSAGNVPARASYKVGDIAGEIQKYVADNQIDLLVMGSHGHGALSNLVMGSVTTKVLSTTKVPVLIVR